MDQALEAEIDTLCYPKAALFGFCIGLFCYNVLSVLKAALRARWGRKEEQEVSFYYLSEEISRAYDGMMVAIPACTWEGFEALSAKQMAQLLWELSGQVQLRAFRRHPRGAKNPKPKRKPLSRAQRSAHIATSRLLATASQTAP